MSVRAHVLEVEEICGSMEALFLKLAIARSSDVRRVLSEKTREQDIPAAASPVKGQHHCVVVELEPSAVFSFIFTCACGFKPLPRNTVRLIFLLAHVRAKSALLLLVVA